MDTLSSMQKAAALYEKAGFVAIEPYYKTPLAGTRFLAKIIEKEMGIGKLYRLILILISVQYCTLRFV